MYVSDQHKFVFIHNPKTAGMSIKYAFYLDDKRNKKFEGDRMHIPMADIHQNFPSIIEKMKCYYTFMLVRNPFTRFISTFSYHHPKVYYQYLQTSKIDHYRKKFDDFIDAMTPNEFVSKRWSNLFIRQVDMAYCNGKKHVNDFYRFEDFPNCLENIGTKNEALGKLLAQVDRFHINYNPMNLTPQQIYTDKTLKKVIELYKDDFETFKYSKEL